ncbi:MAG: hypothetical protein IT198_16745, partial [Acidimicrobiia bacterium]|nr:hypothetical protein [Acidimicrobiia bacterium]
MFQTRNASRRSREVVARGLAVVVIVLGMAVLAGSSEPQRTFGHGTVDQEFSTGLHASSALSNVNSLAQSFTPTESVVVALDLLLTTDGQTTSGPITVSANVREATFAGQWGAVIGTGAAVVPASITATPSSPHILHIELAAPVNVTSGTTYVLQVEPVFDLYWAANTSGGYVGGNGYVGTSSYPTIDFGFRTYYEVASPSDTTPPVISYDLDPELPANGWYNTDVTLDWTVSDPESSVVLDGCDDLALEEDRDIAAYTCSASSAGGSSGPVSVEFGRDTVAPTVLATVTAGTGSNDWYRTDVTVGFSCDDDRAGIEPDACPSEQTLSDEGTVSSTAETVRDRAGTESAPSNIVTVQIDQTKPTISAAISSGTMGDGDWYVSDVVVHFTCADADGSGIPEDGCPGDQTLSGDGAAVTSTGATVFDAAGNESDVSNLITVAIDQTDPPTEASASPVPNEAGWNNTAVSVTFSATDETSGVGACDSAVTLSMDGAGQSATGSCSDQAGNSQSASAVNINIDGTAPEVTVAASRPPDSGADTYDHPVTFTATGSDGLSGIAYCDPPETYSGPFSSTVVVEMACADNAGNIGTATVSFQYVDGTPPSIAFVLSPPLPITGWYTTDVTLTWSVVEAESPGTLVVSGCADQSLSVDRPLTTYSCGATSAGGEATVVEVEFGRDATKPTIAAA